MALEAVRGVLENALGWIVLVTEMLAVLVLLGGITLAFVAGVRSGHPAIDARTRFRGGVWDIRSSSRSSFWWLPTSCGRSPSR